MTIPLVSATATASLPGAQSGFCSSAGPPGKRPVGAPVRPSNTRTTPSPAGAVLAVATAVPSGDQATAPTCPSWRTTGWAVKPTGRRWNSTRCGVAENPAASAVPSGDQATLLAGPGAARRRTGPGPPADTSTTTSSFASSQRTTTASDRGDHATRPV